MKKISIALLAAMLLTFFASGCSQHGTVISVTPPIDSVTVKTSDGNGVITLVMRTFEEGLSAEDVNSIRAEAENLLGTVYKPDGPKVTSSTTFEGTEDARLVAFCYAVYSDRVAEPCSFWAANERSVEHIYEQAKEWFFDEVAGIEHF
jgi:hypothetical protein